MNLLCITQQVPVVQLGMNTAVSMATVQDILPPASVTLTATSAKTVAVIFTPHAVKVHSTAVHYCNAFYITVCVSVGSPRAPLNVMVLDIMATSVRIMWTIPFVVSTQETYYVQYGLDPGFLTHQFEVQFSGPNITQTYSVFLTGLDPADTYYFRVLSTNNAGQTGSDLDSFTTDSGRKLNTTTINTFVLVVFVN